MRDGHEASIFPSPSRHLCLIPHAISPYPPRHFTLSPTPFPLIPKAIFSPFHLFIFSPFHLCAFSPFHLFTFSPFHPFTFKCPFTFSPFKGRSHLITFSPFHLFTLWFPIAIAANRAWWGQTAIRAEGSCSLPSPSLTTANILVLRILAPH